MADLRVRMTLDGAAFLQGVTSLRQGLNTTFSGLQNQLAAAFSVGAITALSHRTLQYAGHMRDLSDRLGVNVEWLQKMANTAALAGGSVDDLANMMTELGKSRQEALIDPSGKAAQAFTRLGFGSGEIRNLSQQNFFDKLVKSFANGATVQTENDAMEVGGKAAKNLLAAFAAGFDEAGPVMPEWVIDELDNAADALTRLGQTLVVEFGPALAFIADLFQSFVQRSKQWIAGIGGLTAFFDVGRFVAEVKNGTGTAYVKDAAKRGWKAFQDETNRVAVEQEEKNDTVKLAQRDARARRRQREGSGPGFNVTEKEEKEKLSQAKRAEIRSDALIAVGNFLGTTNRSNIESIQMETNRILRDHTRLLTKISEGRVATSSWDDLGLPDSGTATSSF